MTVTLTELIAAVREEVRDAGSVRWTDATITRYLNEGQDELGQTSLRIEVWEKVVAAGATAVEMPTDLLYTKEASWETESENHPLNIRSGQPETQPGETGEPEDVYVINGDFVLDPLPDTAGTLIVAGTLRMTKMVLGTSTPFLEDADSALLAHAIYRCHSSDGDPMTLLKEREWTAAKLRWTITDAQKTPGSTTLNRRR